MKKLPIFLVIIAGALALIAAAGLSYGLSLAVLPAIAAIALVVAAVIAQILSGRLPRFYKVASRITASLLCIAVALCAIASAQIFSKYFDDEIPENTVVIVLGCGLSQTDQISPSLMLYGRLRAADKYISANPDAVIILSGGQGANERISEAAAMYRYFESRGVDMTNIYMEDESSNTEQNLAYSFELARAEGIDLANGVAIVTDGFHQFRAHRHAHSLGLEAYTVSANAPVALQIFYWAREIPGIITQSWFSSERTSSSLVSHHG